MDFTTITKKIKDLYKETVKKKLRIRENKSLLKNPYKKNSLEQIKMMIKTSNKLLNLKPSPLQTRYKCSNSRSQTREKQDKRKSWNVASNAQGKKNH